MFLITVGLISCGGHSVDHEASEALSTDPVELLERSAAALRAAGTVRYDFRYGGPDDPTGFATGTTWMKQVTRLEDSWIRVEGTIHAQEQFGVERQDFTYGSDGEQAWSQAGDGPVEVAAVGAGGNRLSARGVYGFLPEFVEATPLWRERTLAGSVEGVGRELLDGTDCDVVRVEVPLDGGETSEIVWSLSVDDHLPRRGRWRAAFTGPDGVVFDLTGLEVGIPLAQAQFSVPSSGERATQHAIAVGDAVPVWSLARADGSMVRADELLGKVVVLDFWNTWCPICRSIAPATHSLAEEFGGEPVQFFGVNLLEQNDPVAYWESVDAPYPLLLEGDELAILLDLPWQPGVAVIGRDGTLLFKQFGASSDRIDRLREAIESGLAEG